MDAFETIIKTVLEAKGYWVRPGYKVELTKDEKRRIGRPSSPRWEIDVLAYKPAMNEIVVAECKSYLDSRGVRLADLVEENSKSRYKLFSDQLLRKTVFCRLRKQLLSEGLCRPKPDIRLAPAAGKIPNHGEREKISS